MWSKGLINRGIYRGSVVGWRSRRVAVGWNGFVREWPASRGHQADIVADCRNEEKTDSLLELLLPFLS